LEWRGKTGMNDRLLRKTVATTLILLLVLPDARLNSTGNGSITEDSIHNTDDRTT